VSGFSADWLALREPADAAARSSELVRFVVRDSSSLSRRDAESAALHSGRHFRRLVDLGGGTGANIRYLSARLPTPQHWTIVDDDAELLARAPTGVTTRRADLNHVVDDESVFRESALVTASALLDLVSDRWLERLVDRCRRAGAAVLFALTYDGRTICEPTEPEDDEVGRLVNEHQRRDKGFGAALGPAAAARAVELLSTAGYDVKHERSDWRLGPDDAALQRQLITGWLQAASEVTPGRAGAFERWRDRRLALVDARRSRIVVGHVDVAGVRRA
jgi:hypothetical protein